MPSFVPSTKAPTHLGRFRTGFRDPDADAVLGVPFCIDEFGSQARLAVEAAFGANIKGDPYFWTWYDITGDVRYADGGRVSITPMGRSDEASTANPAGCAFVLDNDTGDYTAYATESRWWPYVRRNTPIRVRINLTGLPADWAVRFEGYATGFTPSWDQSANVAVVGVSAQGITRRLQQGTTPLKAPLTRSIAALTPTAFWPCDDADGATQIGSGLTNGQSMAFTDGVNAGAYTDIFGQGKAIEVGTGSLFGVVDTTLTPANADTSFVFGFALKTVEMPIADPRSLNPIVSITTSGNYYRWDVFAPNNIGSIGIVRKSSAEIDFGYGLAHPDDLDNVWHFYEFAISYSAATNTFSVASYVDGIAGTSHAGTPNAATASTSAVKSIVINPNQINFDVFGFGGLYVKNGTSIVQWAGAAVDGWTGESPPTRVSRLCREEGVQAAVTGTSDTAMGPQSVATLLALLQECETAEQGVLFDGRGPGVSFVTRSARYNLTASLQVDAALDQLGDPFEPVDDDQRNRNVAKASRKNGSSAVFEQVAGDLGTDAIGVYDTSITVNVETDNAVAPYAEWTVHLGTIAGFRFPHLSLNFRATPELAPAWLACSVSSRINVLNPASVATQITDADIALVLEGWDETLSPLDWTAKANTSQYEGWEVGQLDLSKVLDCGASYLANVIDTATTAIPLLIADTCTWTHASGDFDIRIGAEVMTVTAVSAASGSGSAWTQTLTVTRAVNGVSMTHPALDEVHVNDPLILAL